MLTSRGSVTPIMCSAEAGISVQKRAATVCFPFKPHRNVSSGRDDTSFEVILKRLMTYSGFRHHALRELLFGNTHI